MGYKPAPSKGINPLSKRTLTILGSGQSWKKCPFTGDIWAVATCLITDGMRDKPFTKVFAVDSDEFPEMEECLRIAKERHIPVVSTRDYATELYPVQDIRDEFRTGYCENTVSYMLALAIFKISVDKEYDDFAVYGIDQSEGEYLAQKPFVTFWLGVANGRGIDFTIASSKMPKYFTEIDDFEESLRNLIMLRKNHNGVRV